MNPGTALLLLCPVVILFLIGSGHEALPLALDGTLADTDSLMRLVLLEEALTDGRWAAIAMARDGAPSGYIMHWSAPMNALILLIARAAVAAGAEIRAALLWSGLATHIVLTLLTIATVAWALHRAKGLGPAVLGAALLCSAPLFINYGAAGRIDHHIATLLPLCLAVGLLISRDTSRWRSFLAGASLGSAVWISVEAVPFALMILGLAVSFDPTGLRHRHAYAGLGLISAIGAAVLVDPVAMAHAQPLDHVSLPFLVLAGLIAAGLAVAPIIPTSWPAILKTGAAGGALVAATVVWVLLYPGILRAPDILLGPDLKALWWANISELSPPRSVAELVSVLFVPCAAVAFAAARAVSFGGRPAALAWWSVALVGCVCVALAAMHLRFSPYASLYAAFVIPLALPRGPRLSLSSIKGQLAALATVVCLHFGAGPALEALTGADERPISTSAECDVRELANLAPALGHGTVLIDPDYAPAVLWLTSARTIAAPFQRNPEGLLDAYRALSTADPNTARTIMRDRGVTHILICKTRRTSLLTPSDRDTLHERLVRGELPPWLERRSPESHGGLLLFEVKAEAG